MKIINSYVKKDSFHRETRRTHSVRCQRQCKVRMKQEEVEYVYVCVIILRMNDG